MARTKEGCERSKIYKEIRECFKTQDLDNSVINSLEDDLYWQIVNLRKCRDILDEDGIVVDFKQGSQDMKIQHPAMKTYNDLIKNQTATIKTLLSLTNSDAKDSELKGMMDFLNKGKKQIRAVK